MTRARASIGFEDDISDFDAIDPAEWAVGTPARTRPETGTTQRAAEATGFRSREGRGGTPPETTPDLLPRMAADAPQTRSAPRRRRTGRNAQFNLKARPDTIESFCAVADANGWGLGETLEQAVQLLLREYGAHGKSE
ncbi:hypothetical protein [Puniceibacterium sp. IMCC21224]|uniref:hypothetical protein n=1 Tax=Puniceibacterium sp. IMCC21224 TaxID=1618204 RepID=UPI00064DF492|nr:hypothetical protein [Puniceibacterium sp. IMCC21224]KMK63822.1 hypothetical protein IMCC21224_189 [Puniceibacterium sp. IMCC21224]